MRRVLRAAGWSLTILSATLLCGRSSHRAPHVLHTALPFTSATLDEPDVVLPAGFTAAVDRATSDQFVRVVADDVDRDGDIDVVASLGSLDLIVWRNDGAGHFTRLPSSHHLAFQTQPPSPSVDGDSLTSSEWIQDDGRAGGRLAPLRPIVDAAPRAVVVARLSLVTPQSGPRVRSSRAPPLAPSL